MTVDKQEKLISDVLADMWHQIYCFRKELGKQHSLTKYLEKLSGCINEVECEVHSYISDNVSENALGRMFAEEAKLLNESHQKTVGRHKEIMEDIAKVNKKVNKMKSKED